MVAVLIDNPHFSFPFRLDGSSHPVVVEQDSDDEIMDCLQVLLSTVQGERMDIPDYGIRDQAFQMNGVDVGHLQRQIARFEPRANVNLSPGQVVAAIQRVSVEYQGRTSA